MRRILLALTYSFLIAAYLEEPRPPPRALQSDLPSGIGEVHYTSSGSLNSPGVLFTEHRLPMTLSTEL